VKNPPRCLAGTGERRARRPAHHPLPFLRLAAAHPDTVDAVFRNILRQRDFTWAVHGEALMRCRKAWYYRHEPRPGVSVIGARLLELAFGGRG